MPVCKEQLPLPLVPDPRDPRVVVLVIGHRLRHDRIMFHGRNDDNYVRQYVRHIRMARVLPVLDSDWIEVVW